MRAQQGEGLADRTGRRLPVAFLLLALVVVVALVGAYLFGPARFWFSSEDAMRLLMADVAVRQGRPVAHLRE